MIWKVIAAHFLLHCWLGRLARDCIYLTHTLATLEYGRFRFFERQTDSMEDGRYNETKYTNS